MSSGLAMTSKFRNLIKLMREKTLPFALHSFIKTQQSLPFRTFKNRENVLLIQVDFSENYAIKFQDEIQTMHWVKEQLTVFTCVASGHEMKSFALVSDDLQHNKAAVLIFLDVIFNELDAFDGGYEEIVIFSDGAPG